MDFNLMINNDDDDDNDNECGKKSDENFFSIFSFYVCVFVSMEKKARIDRVNILFFW